MYNNNKNSRDIYACVLYSFAKLREQPQNKAEQSFLPWNTLHTEHFVLNLFRAKSIVFVCKTWHAPNYKNEMIMNTLMYLTI